MMNLEIEICGVHVKPLEFDPVEPSIWFTVNGVKLVEWVNVSEDGFTLERVDTYEYYNREEFMEACGFCDEDEDQYLFEFLPKLREYLQETLNEEFEEYLANDPFVYELRWYGPCFSRVDVGSEDDQWIWAASTIEALELYMRALAPWDKHQYYIAESGTHKIIKHY